MLNMETVKAYGGVEAIPTSFLVDKEGKYCYKTCRNGCKGFIRKRD